jgi:hypothetical protein
MLAASEHPLRVASSRLATAINQSSLDSAGSNLDCFRRCHDAKLHQCTDALMMHRSCSSLQYNINVYFNVVGELISAALCVEQPRKDPSHLGASSRTPHPKERWYRS